MRTWLTMCKICKDTFRLHPDDHLRVTHPDRMVTVEVEPETKLATITEADHA